MPVDQQPCTTAFCEVHDAAEIDGVEEVHVVKEGIAYDLSNESTFTRASLSDLNETVSENENGQQILKVYLSNPRSPAPLFLHNSAADISLIDAPGLNRDSVKTIAVFARQEEIDVVIWTRYVAASRSFTPSSSYRRPSILSILLVPLSESVCANSDTYVALEPYCRPHTPFRIQFLISVPSPLPQEVPVIYTKGPSMVQRFASNGSECTSWTVRRKSPKCAIDTIISVHRR